ncbi:hypothetical protein PUN28_014930 [Cardiocondyla obscurior]|uniref:TIL domain-containing protein n=1 Tax=Cardiocondyla obscurior TaxID=286306 RepID=A0AAW2EW64_9HYME
MSRGVVLLFLIVAIVTIDAAPNCGPNEVYNTCGSSCVPSCQNPNPTVCTLACKIGCECVEGYVRNARGRCVLTQDC